MKKFFLVIAIIATIAFVTGIPVLVSGIRQRGFGGVNYGRVLFPLLIGIIFFVLFKKRQD